MKRLFYAASTARHLLDFHIPILSELQKSGYDITIACRDTCKLPTGLRTVEIPFSKGFFSADNIKALQKLRELFKQESFDIISTHTALAGFIIRAALLSRFKDRPFCVHTVHGYLFGRRAAFSGQITYLFERLCKPVTDAIITMNKEDSNYARKLVKKGGQVISTRGMGVDISRFKPREADEKEHFRLRLGMPDSFLIFCAAEFSARKNHKTIIRAMPEILRFIPNANLLLAGDGVLMEKMRHLAIKLEVSGNINFLGYVPDTSLYLKAADMAVSASLSEGMPLGIMEALSCGVPVAASQVKGHSDLLVNTVNLLFEPHSASQLAQCCKEIERRLKMTEQPENSNFYPIISQQEATIELMQIYTEFLF